MDGFTPGPPHGGDLRIAAAAPATPARAAESRERPQTARSLVRRRASLEVRTRNGPAGSGQICFCRRGPACEPDRTHHWSAAHPRFFGKDQSVRSAWRVGCGPSPERAGLAGIRRKQGKNREIASWKGAQMANRGARRLFCRASTGSWEPISCSGGSGKSWKAIRVAVWPKQSRGAEKAEVRLSGALSSGPAVRRVASPAPTALVRRSRPPLRHRRAWSKGA